MIEDSPIAVVDRIKASIDEAFAVITKFGARSDRESQSALDELRASLRVLQRTFSDYETVLDRMADQLSRHALSELRAIIRKQRKVIDEWFWNPPYRRKI
jgi:hypothetical protein